MFQNPGLLGNTPLHMAALNGHTADVELLLRYGANSIIRNAEGKTPLDVANPKFPKIREILPETLSERLSQFISGAANWLTPAITICSATATMIPIDFTDPMLVKLGSGLQGVLPKSVGSRIRTQGGEAWVLFPFSQADLGSTPYGHDPDCFHASAVVSLGGVIPSQRAQLYRSGVSAPSYNRNAYSSGFFIT